MLIDISPGEARQDLSFDTNITITKTSAGTYEIVWEL